MKERTAETTKELKKVVRACGKRGANTATLIEKCGLEEPRVRYLIGLAKKDGLVEYEGSRRVGVYKSIA